MVYPYFSKVFFFPAARLTPFRYNFMGTPAKIALRVRRSFMRSRKFFVLTKSIEGCLLKLICRYILPHPSIHSRYPQLRLSSLGPPCEENRNVGLNTPSNCL